jgi:hypothetical protein
VSDDEVSHGVSQSLREKLFCGPSDEGDRRPMRLSVSPDDFLSRIDRVSRSTYIENRQCSSSTSLRILLAQGY